MLYICYLIMLFIFFSQKNYYLAYGLLYLTLIIVSGTISSGLSEQKNFFFYSSWYFGKVYKNWYYSWTWTTENKRIVHHWLQQLHRYVFITCQNFGGLWTIIIIIKWKYLIIFNVYLNIRNIYLIGSKICNIL